MRFTHFKMVLRNVCRLVGYGLNVGIVVVDFEFVAMFEEGFGSVQHKSLLVVESWFEHVDGSLFLVVRLIDCLTVHHALRIAIGLVVATVIVGVAVVLLVSIGVVLIV